MFFFAMNVIATPLAVMKQRKAIHNPWLPNIGVSRYHEGKNINIVAIIIVFLIALEAVAPIYIPSHMNAANVINGMTII
jgi:hypothetical protein